MAPGSRGGKAESGKGWWAAWLYQGGRKLDGACSRSPITPGEGGPVCSVPGSQRSPSRQGRHRATKEKTRRLYYAWSLP